MSRMDKWMPLFISDYLADTRGLSAEEHGAYLLLLMDYWQHGPLVDDDKRLAAIARVDRRAWNRSVGPVIRSYFAIGDDGRLHQKRLDKERAHAQDLSEKRRIAAGKKAPKYAPSEQHESNDINVNEQAIASDLHDVCIPTQNPAIVPDRSAKVVTSRDHKMSASGNQKSMLFPMPKSNDINAPDQAIASSLHPICTPFARVLHDSLSRDLVQEERREGRKEENKISSLRSDSCKPPLPAAEPAGFVKWYDRYPRKVGRADACKAYVKARKTATEAEIYAGLVSYPFEAEVHYQPMPSTWLNKCRWQHEPAAVVQAPRMSMQAELERLTRRGT